MTKSKLLTAAIDSITQPPNGLILTVKRTLGRQLDVSGYGVTRIGTFVIDPGLDFIGTLWSEDIPYVEIDGMTFVPSLRNVGLVSARITTVPGIDMLLRRVSRKLFRQELHQHTHPVESLADLGRILRDDHRKCAWLLERRRWVVGGVGILHALRK